MVTSDEWKWCQVTKASFNTQTVEPQKQVVVKWNGFRIFYFTVQEKKQVLYLILLSATEDWVPSHPVVSTEKLVREISATT